MSARTNRAKLFDFYPTIQPWNRLHQLWNVPFYRELFRLQCWWCHSQSTILTWWFELNLIWSIWKGEKKFARFLVCKMSGYMKRLYRLNSCLNRYWQTITGELWFVSNGYLHKITPILLKMITERTDLNTTHQLVRCVLLVVVNSFYFR